MFVIAYVTLTCLGANNAHCTDPGELGRKIFFDPALSASGQMACSTCHDPRYAYGPPPGKGIAMGGPHLDRGGTRAVPSLRYLHDAPPFSEKTRFADGDIAPGGGFTWDGRAGTLKEQARIPLPTFSNTRIALSMRRSPLSKPSKNTAASSARPR